MPLLFSFIGSVRHIKLAIRQLFSFWVHVNIVYRNVSYRIVRSRVQIVYIGYEWSRVRTVQGTNSLGTNSLGYKQSRVQGTNSLEYEQSVGYKWSRVGLRIKVQGTNSPDIVWHELCKNGWTDRDAVFRYMGSGEPKEACLGWRSETSNLTDCGIVSTPCHQSAWNMAHDH